MLSIRYRKNNYNSSDITSQLIHFLQAFLKNFDNANHQWSPW